MLSLENLTSSRNTALRSRLSPAVLSAPILLVDDQELNIEFMAVMLREAGFHNLHTAFDGLKALEKIKAINPDLVVLDVMMPIMSGIDLCRILRDTPQYAEMPILVQTGLSTVHDRIEIFGVGATDLILKPINGLELISRVSLHIERKLLIDGLTKTRNRLTQELESAQEMQLDLLPSASEQRAVRTRLGLDVASSFTPSSELGGDMWGLFYPSQYVMGVFMTDFAGHGVQAAMNTFRLHTLIHDHRALPNRPGELLTDLNVRLNKLLPSGQFATMTCLYIDTCSNVLSWASAGSPPPLLRTNVQTWRNLPSAGLPLGILPGTEYETHEISFGPGSAIALYSDALSETVLDDGTRLEDSGILNIMQGMESGTDAQTTLSNLLAGFQCRLSGPLCDDLTSLVVRNVGQSAVQMERVSDAAQ